MEARDNHGDHDNPTAQAGQGGDARPARPPRRPYVPPVIVSGEAFERVQLNSGCNEGIEDCEIPC